MKRTGAGRYLVLDTRAQNKRTQQMFGGKSDREALLRRIRLLGTQSTPSPQLTFKNGAIRLANGEVISIVISALDANTARIELPVRLDLPSHVTLIEPSSKLHVLASVRWQRDTSAALSFNRG